MPATIKFWGTQGSIAGGLVAKDVDNKIRTALAEFAKTPGQNIDEFMAQYAASAPFTYGSNTSCVEVTYEGLRYVFDLGTGARPLGNSLFPEMFRKGGLNVVFVVSHLHWDHIQGLPFFGPLH